MSSAGESREAESIEEQIARLQQEIARFRAQIREEIRQKEACREARKSNFPELLDACHVHLSVSLEVQKPSTATKGNLNNAENKLRPNKTIDLGRVVGKRKVSSEQDLDYFEKTTVLIHVVVIVGELYDNETLRQRFKLKGTISYENHSNMLDSEGMSGQELPEMDEETRSSAPQQSSARQLRSTTIGSAHLATSSASFAAPGSTPKRALSNRPPADQICVYNTSQGMTNPPSRVTALVIEYKAPHKMPVSVISEGLQDMDLDEVVISRDPESLQDPSRRSIAAVITQTFSYMVRAGLEYGYVCTGEAFIFLHGSDDPTTVEYYLSVPNQDVGLTTGWNSDNDEPNRLHAIAVGQTLAFTLGALRKPARGMGWRRKAAAVLQHWEIVYEDLFEARPMVDTPASAYIPSKEAKEWLRSSPVRLRSGKLVGGVPSCRSPLTSLLSSDDDDDEFDPDTPSRPPTRRPPAPAAPSSSTRTVDKSTSEGDDRWANSRPEGRSRSYCTPQCLLGLLTQGPLDKNCPNRREHGVERHTINRATLMRLLRKQLAEDLDFDVVNLGVCGSRGAMFQITLTSHGYTLAAKGTTLPLTPYLLHEEQMYRRLRPIQGNHVPVCLGHIDLVESLPYEGVVDLVHMMLMSFGDRPIYDCLKAEKESRIIEAATCSMQAVHRLGVLHRDASARNLLWNEETEQVTVIDFERAELPRPRPALPEISPNRKRQWEDASTSTTTEADPRRRVQYAKEIKAMTAGLEGYFRAHSRQG